MLAFGINVQPRRNAFTFQRMIKLQAIGRRHDLISIGTTRLTFTIDRSGRVNNLKVIENTANEAFAIVCIQSVQELKLPPIPEDVAATLPPEGLQQELTFILYAN